jgi:hypothetical protein
MLRMTFDAATRLWMGALTVAGLSWMPTDFREMALANLAPIFGVAVVCAAFASLMLQRPWSTNVIPWTATLALASWAAAALPIAYRSGFNDMAEVMLTGVGFVPLPVMMTILLLRLGAASSTGRLVRGAQTGLIAVALGPMSVIVVLIIIFILTGDGV